MSDDRAPKPIDDLLPPIEEPAEKTTVDAAAAPAPTESDFNPFTREMTLPSAGQVPLVPLPADEQTEGMPPASGPAPARPPPPTLNNPFAKGPTAPSAPPTQPILTPLPEPVPVDRQPTVTTPPPPAMANPFVPDEAPAPSAPPPPTMANPFTPPAASPAAPPPTERIDKAAAAAVSARPPPAAEIKLEPIEPHKPVEPAARSQSAPRIAGAPRVAGAPPTENKASGGPDPRVKAVIKAFDDLARGVKRLVFNKHRLDEYASYLEQAHQSFSDVLAQVPRLELRAEVSTFVLGDLPVLEDDKRENNLIYPLWNEGVRLLVFKQGLTLKDLLKFITVVLDIFPRDPSEDLLSALWKAELTGIEWVALNDFSLVEGAEAEEVEVKVEEVLAFLQRQLSTETGEGLANAKVNLSDLELKLSDVAALKQLKRGGPLYSAEYKELIQQELSAEESRLLDKICSVIFEVMRLPASDDELEDIAAALEQLLDGLVLQGKFGTINRVISFAEELAYEAGASTANRDLGRRISERLQTLIAQPERVRGIATALNAGRGQSLEELTSYLERLGPHSAVMLLEMVDMLTNPRHRRAVCDALAELGKNAVPLFAGRIKKASSNLAKDLFYIIDKIDPPDKASILEPVLDHENAVLRMEVMNLLAKSKDDKALQLVARVFKSHDVPQMRAHAARVMTGFPEGMVIKHLMAAVNEGFDERPPMEQRAVLAALAGMDHPSARTYIRGILEEKSGILKSRKVDERKLLLVKALSGQAGIPALKMLGDIAAAKSLHSKEVLEAARDAALKMRDRMQGAPS